MLDDATAQLVRNSLRIGEYNLLLGSGISLDSENRDGRSLEGAGKLAKTLSDAVGLPDTKPLTVVTSILSDSQRAELLTKPFTVKKPGNSVLGLPRYVWQRIFSLNIDDAVEVAYETHVPPIQAIIPVNYDEDYSPTPNKSEVVLIHLHGSVRNPGTSYVFSTTEYARLLSAGSRWASIFSQIVRTEPLIIIGTSFDEVDLQYYLQQRTTKVTRAGTGPSLFVSPHIDLVSKHLCDRHGLLPVAASATELFAYLEKLLPNVPTPLQLVLPSKADLFQEAVSKRNQLQFFSDFRLLEAWQPRGSAESSPFLNGVPPTWDDMYLGLDIARSLLGSVVGDVIAETDFARIVIVSGDPGDGATTLIKRAALEIVKQGIPVLEVAARGRIDASVAREALAKIKGKPVLLVDDLANRTGEIDDLLSDVAVSRKIRAVVSAARNYRLQYILERLGRHPIANRKLPNYSAAERDAVVTLCNQLGIIGDPAAMRHKPQFVADLAGDPAAVVACRILNDLKPLREICKSLWKDAFKEDKRLYLALAIAEVYAHAGVYRPVAQDLAGNASIIEMIESDSPLPIVEDPEDAEQVRCGNVAVASGILDYVAAVDPSAMRDAYLHLASTLSPYVNRSTIKKQTPEAHLMGRILDADDTVTKLFGEKADEVFEQLTPRLGWNSRFWEQRSLYFIDRDVSRAVKHARHAVSIEQHPHTLTTLGKVLAAAALAVKPPESTRFDEAATVLPQQGRGAAQKDGGVMRVDPWPFIIAAYAITILGTLAVTFWSWQAMRKAERDAAALSERRED